ncbi:KH domain-containing protein [Apostasia shenzhenica]|uniref:KH domain-containing protein n=1 Tax=Apostasia shenzhenica TaxID=1088818 RepID=A0A2I0ACP6_9ASPA|nr:KH domain-containing protein [Apostasia shenzhenica]
MATATAGTADNGAPGAATATILEVKDEFAITRHNEGEETPAVIEEAEPLEEEFADADADADSDAEKEAASDLLAGEATGAGETKKWPGWPGLTVFRLVVPVGKVGGIIGRKGDRIKKLCEETRARIRILEGAVGTSDRIVLISAKDEPELELTPAMDAVLRVFKLVNDLTESSSDGTDQAIAGASVCSVRLLVASSQAVNLIGKQGATIKSIQENAGATIRVLSGDELPYYATSDERIVDIHGESLKVLKGLEAVVAHLRKFLVDHGVLPLFEKVLKMPAAHERASETWGDKQFHRGSDTDSLFLDREAQKDSQFQRTNLSLYGKDPALSGLRSSGSGLGRNAGAIVTQVTQTMQIPLSYAEDIIGIGGGNIAYIRRTSGAVLTVQETRGVPDEITVEIKGSTSQVQTAQQLIQEFIAGHKEPVPSSYGSLDTGVRSSYSQLGGSGYSSSLTASSYGGGYGSSVYEGTGYEGYGGYRY